MYHFFADASQASGDKRILEITGDDYNHIVRVLRKKAGDELSVSFREEGGRGDALTARETAGEKEYRYGIERILPDRIVCGLRFVKEGGAELPCDITLFQALPKADKMELIIQKAVELGVKEIVPFAAARCVTRLDGKRAAAKRLRWERIAEAAARQSRRGIVPRVVLPEDGPLSFAAAAAYAAGDARRGCDVRLIPYELADADMRRTRECIERIRPGQSIAVFIGPEGGFTGEEIALARANGFTAVTMGRRILRTETAGMVMLAWLVYALESGDQPS